MNDIHEAAVNEAVRLIGPMVRAAMRQPAAKPLDILLTGLTGVHYCISAAGLDGATAAEMMSWKAGFSTALVLIYRHPELLPLFHAALQQEEEGRGPIAEGACERPLLEFLPLVGLGGAQEVAP